MEKTVPQCTLIKPSPCTLIKRHSGLPVSPMWVWLATFLWDQSTLVHRRNKFTWKTEEWILNAKGPKKLTASWEGLSEEPVSQLMTLVPSKRQHWSNTLQWKECDARREITWSIPQISFNTIMYFKERVWVLKSTSQFSIIHTKGGEKWCK